MAFKTLNLIGKNGQVVFQGKLASLPLKEEKIITKSIELFNESDPCIIYRTYAMKKIMLDIDDYMNTLLKNGKTKLDWHDVPEEIKQSIDIIEEIKEMSLDTRNQEYYEKQDTSIFQMK